MPLRKTPMLNRADAMKLQTFVVSLTPFAENGGLDEDRLRAHLRRLAAAGIGVYVGGSGSGEGLTLSPDETWTLYRVAAEELRGRVPVRAMGIEPRTAQEMIALARLAADAELDAMQVYSVLAPGATDAELEEFFADTLSAITIPAVISIYHAAGYVVSPEVVRSVARRFPHLVGVNCTHVDVRLLDLVGDDIAVHVADHRSIFANLVLGGHGFLSQEASTVPGLCVRLVDRFRSGDMKGAAGAYAQLLRVQDVNLRFFHGIKASRPPSKSSDCPPVTRAVPACPSRARN